MRNPLSPCPATAQVSSLEPEVYRLAADTPLEAGTLSGQEDDFQGPLSPCALTQLKFVQIGIWQARRRCLAGQTEDLDILLAHLDEDIELLRHALASEPPRPSQPGKSKARRREAVSLR